MFQSLFKSSQPEIDDDVLEAANRALLGRLETMMQREETAKLRHGIALGQPRYLHS